MSNLRDAISTKIGKNLYNYHYKINKYDILCFDILINFWGRIFDESTD